MNTDVSDLLPESIDRLTDGARVPAGLADRALRRSRQRQVTLGTAAATGTAVFATAAVLVATAGTGAAPRGGSAITARTTAYVVNHTERALAAAERGNVIQEVHAAAQGARFALVPNARFVAQAPRATFWSYRGQFREEGFTSGGRLVFNANAVYAPAGQQRTVQGTGVEYPSKIWWRETAHQHLGPGPAPRGCANFYLPPPDGTQVNWPAQIRHALSCARYQVAGRQWVDGIHAIKIVSVAPVKSSQAFWIDPATYLPVRALWAWSPRHGNGGLRLTGDFRWLAPTKANLAALHVTVPSGFRQLHPNILPQLSLSLGRGVAVATSR